MYFGKVSTKTCLGGLFLLVFSAAALPLAPTDIESGRANPFFNQPIDSVPPVVHFVGLHHYSRLNGQITVTVSALDDTGVSRIELYLEGELLSANNLSPILPAAVVPFGWQTMTATSGKHTLIAKAYDSSGNYQTSAVVVLCNNFVPVPTATPSPPLANEIVIDPLIRYQSMRGWEATAQAAQDYSAAWNNYKNALLDLAVNDLGLNRLRVEIKSGTENPIDYYAQWRSGQISESEYNSHRYESINDNSDPNSINVAGFKWSALDAEIDQIALPMRERLRTRGETLWINVNYVDFGSSTFEHKNSPAEYAEFVLATYLHMRSRYGFVPDSWEVILEPDTSTAAWTASQVAQAIKAAGDRLLAAGFTPNFVAASNTNTENAPVYIDQIAQTPGAMEYVSEFSYHRYCCATPNALMGIANRAVQYAKRTGMLEWIGADYNTLHEDIKSARNSSWQQFTLAGPMSWGPDTGGRYYLIDDTNVNSPIITMGSRTKLLRQYFKFIRRGALRIDARAGSTNFDPLAFINTNGKHVVVVKAAAGGSFVVKGLPTGTYGIKYSTASQYNIDLADVTILSGQSVAANIPAAGVVTVYAK